MMYKNSTNFYLHAIKYIIYLILNICTMCNNSLKYEAVYFTMANNAEYFPMN